MISPGIKAPKAELAVPSIRRNGSLSMKDVILIGAALTALKLYVLRRRVFSGQADRTCPRRG